MTPPADRSEHPPALDQRHLALAAATIGTYCRLAGYQPDPAAYAKRMVDPILPDAVPYRVGSRARHGAGGANGRRLPDDAMDAALSWVVGATVSDGVEQPDGRVGSTVPFVGPVACWVRASTQYRAVGLGDRVVSHVKTSAAPSSRCVPPLSKLECPPPYRLANSGGPALGLPPNPSGAGR